MAGRASPARRLLGAMTAVGAFLAGCKHPSAQPTATDAGAVVAAVSTAGTVPSATASAASFHDAPAFVSDGPFEGDMTMTLTAAGAPSVVVFEVKGTKLRLNIAGESTYAILDDAAAASEVTVSPAKKTATRATWESALLVVALVQPPFGDGIPGETGLPGVVAGHLCEVYRFQEEGGDKGEACIVRGMPFPHRGASDVFSMRTVTTEASGKEKKRIEVTAVDRKPLDDALFVVPAGYKTVVQKDTGWQR